MQNLIIFGAGGMARETVAIIDSLNYPEKIYDLMGFAVDDEYYEVGRHIMGYPVYSRKWLLDHKDNLVCVCGIGYPKDRRRVMLDLEKNGVKFVTVISPYAYVADKSAVGEGCIIGAYCFVSPDVSIGKGVFLNGPMVAIGHDSTVGSFVTCFPKAQISGKCSIGEAALIGSMAYVHEKKTVGEEAVVAPGAVVLRNVKAGAYAIGNPARNENL